MRAKGYSDDEALNQTLLMQVHRESHKIETKNTPCLESAAVLLLLTLAMAVTAARVARPALRTIITPNQTAALVVVVGEIKTGILSYPEIKVRKTSHQDQISKQNERKCKAVHTQAHKITFSIIPMRFNRFMSASIKLGC